jgi:hypothetical protein
MHPGWGVAYASATGLSAAVGSRGLTRSAATLRRGTCLQQGTCVQQGDVRAAGDVRTEASHGAPVSEALNDAHGPDNGRAGPASAPPDRDCNGGRARARWALTLAGGKGWP